MLPLENVNVGAPGIIVDDHLPAVLVYEVETIKGVELVAMGIELE